jgi:molecular chaperone GrpE
VSPVGSEDDPEAVAPSPSDPTGPSDRIGDLEAQVVELEHKWKRAVADLDNLWKRCTREIERERSDERARVAAQLLPVVDNLELALEHAGANPEVLLEGVRAVRDQAVSVLARLGFARHAEVGEPFDPTRHEAVSAIPDREASPGTVVGVIRPGYGEDDHQLRPAAVVVATRPD